MTGLLGGRYRPLGRIATGGMGEVWRAADELLGREVAVKLLRRHVAADPAFRDRFRMEARLAARLADPHIAQVFDYGEADGVAYLVMELVPGQSLARILARDGALAPEVTLDVVEQTAKGLLAAHNAGIIHRDIKPGNLLVTETGTIKITDFGIARALEAAPVTQTGTLLGTAQYLSPEQASGAPLTYATDLYSLGVVAYECLAGHPPFRADNQVAIALMHINDGPPPLPGSVPPPVRELVMACLAKDPERRPGGAGALSDRARALRGSPAVPEAADLATLTDPAGWRAEPAGSWPEEIAPVLSAPGEPGREAALPVTPVAPATPADVTRPTPRRRGLSRKAVAVAAVTACAAALGLGTLIARNLADHGGETGREKAVVPVSSPRTKPTITPSRTRQATTRPPVPPTKTFRPPPTPSATVSTSATPSVEPTTSPSPSPSPSPSTPTPTPTTPPATPSLTPSTTPTSGTTEQPNGET
ncbi:putative serine/threonine-protein kinase PknA [Streptosporangium violaceochromogenes]|nr:putative serine/threonine-protein kinase PknA [Streptosporangium violaceochromogenes]